MTKKCYLLDLDGTMYRGTAIIEGAKVFIDYCLKEQLPFLFLTNNSGRTAPGCGSHAEDRLSGN